MLASSTAMREAVAAPQRLARTRPSQATTIYHALREELVSVSRLPGSLISEATIAQAYRVSRTPVREALLKLADEGLVDIVPQSGTRAARIPVSSLPEAILIRRALEETTARRAAERASVPDVKALREIVATQRLAMTKNDRNAFHEADEEFHSKVASIAGHPGIWRLIQSVKLQVDRYRRLTLPQKGRLQRVIREHGRVIAAIAQQDGDSSAEAMGTHLDGLMSDIAATRALNPEYFDAN